MTIAALQKKYCKWMCKLIGAAPTELSYKKLLEHLHQTPFCYTLARDGNRAEDGVDLRYYFGYLHNIEDAAIANSLDVYDCSVLEMMVALAMRCEDHIMKDVELGDRTGIWFWQMISNLDLLNMDDVSFDERSINDILYRFMMREYDASGKGGLFISTDPTFDARSTEIWYQMNHFLVTTYRQH